MDNLHFIPNNILTKFFKELTKYKNDYQQNLNYIQEYIMHLIVYLLSIFMHMHVITSQYIIISEAERNSNQSFNFVLCVLNYLF